MPEKTEAQVKKEEAATAKAAKKKKADDEAADKQKAAETALAVAEPEWSTARVDPNQKGASLIPVNFTSFKAAFDFCGLMVKTGFLPDTVDTGPKAMAIAIYGQELGIPLMTSFRTIHVINGRPSLSAEMMLAKFIQRGGQVKWGETSDKVCEGLFISKGCPEGFKASFTEAQAQTAGLLSKQVWKNYKPDMLRARCISRGVRGSDPAAIAGLHTPEEIGGDMTRDGKLIDAEIIAPVPTDIDLASPMKATKGEDEQAGSERDDGSPPPADVQDEATDEERATALAAAEEDSRHQESEPTAEEKKTAAAVASQLSAPTDDQDPEGLFK